MIISLTIIIQPQLYTSKTQAERVLVTHYTKLFNWSWIWNVKLFNKKKKTHE